MGCNILNSETNLNIDFFSRTELKIFKRKPTHSVQIDKGTSYSKIMCLEGRESLGDDMIIRIGIYWVPTMCQAQC